MVELIALILFVASVAGVIGIIVKKMPAAHQLPEKGAELRLATLFGVTRSWIIAKIKKTRYFKDFNWIDFVQKQLLKVRVVVMKTENKINDYILKLRQRSENQKKKEEALLDNYWHDLKAMVKTKNPLMIKKNHDCAGEHAPEEKVSIKEPAIKFVESQLMEPMIEKVAMPEEVAKNHLYPQKKKRGGNQKKRKVRDPFSW